MTVDFLPGVESEGGYIMGYTYMEKTEIKIAILMLLLIISFVSIQACVTSPTPLIPEPTVKTTATEQDLLTETVVIADVIVLGTITEQRDEVVNVGEGDKAGKRYYVTYTLTVEKVVKGDPGMKEVFIREEAGVVDGNERYFPISVRVLLSLKRENGNYYSLFPPGVLWIKGPQVPIPSIIKGGTVTALHVKDMIGIICKNNGRQ